METPVVRNEAKHRTEALRHVKRRLTIDLESVPAVHDALMPKKPSNKKKENSRGKMPRCRSLPEFSGKKNFIPLESGKAPETMKISSQLCEIASKYLTEAEESNALSVAKEHNYSYQRVKMTFGGKLGSLEKSCESPPVLRRGEGTTNTAGATESSEENKPCFLEKHAVDQSMAQGAHVKNVQTGKRPAYHKAEQNGQESSKSTELEEYWLSASYPPPSLSAFPTLLQGRSSVSTPHLLPSRSSSIGSIGELDRWLFPGDTESPSLAADHVIKTVATPKGLSPDEVTPPIISSCSSPPKLTTQASPACQAVVSPQPLLPHSAQRLYESRMMNLSDGSPAFVQEPLLTSTPKYPKSQRPPTGIAESLPNSSECQSADNSMPVTPLESISEDLGKIKPIDEGPEQQRHVETSVKLNANREQQSPASTEMYDLSPRPLSNPLIIDEDFRSPISPLPAEQKAMPCKDTCAPSQTCGFQEHSSLGQHPPNQTCSFQEHSSLGQHPPNPTCGFQEHSSLGQHQTNIDGRPRHVVQDGLQSVQRFPDCIPVFQLVTRGNVKSRPVDRIERHALPQSKNILPLLPLAFNFPGQVMQRLRSECIQITANVTNVSASPMYDSQVASANAAKHCHAQPMRYLRPATFANLQSQMASSTQAQQTIMSKGFQACGSGSGQGVHFYPSNRVSGDPAPVTSAPLQSCPMLTPVTSRRTAPSSVAHLQTSVALPPSRLPPKESSVAIDTMLLQTAKRGCAFIPIIQTLLPSPSTSSCLATKYV
ncbi:uncharacterized protein [Diadema antillarum]|uniref:uncharacterized protein n=1 Tax=Diadema antillarum TaxID=105358 RepID=UPI003A836DBE